MCVLPVWFYILHRLCDVLSVVFHHFMFMLRLSVCLSFFFFFFSSRRRHTRCLSDWSSDVCSSDLPRRPYRARGKLMAGDGQRRGLGTVAVAALAGAVLLFLIGPVIIILIVSFKIGRASCRERV